MLVAEGEGLKLGDGEEGLGVWLFMYVRTTPLTKRNARITEIASLCKLFIYFTFTVFSLIGSVLKSGFFV